ncbi:MAG: hypothetical protein EXR93_00010 [Gemmatimonadetes bacterium]|nr:hypothetical protein [Gemmatimonadota bacterium]
MKNREMGKGKRESYSPDTGASGRETYFSLFPFPFSRSFPLSPFPSCLLVALVLVAAPLRAQQPTTGAGQGLPQLPGGMTPQQALQMAQQRPEIGRLLSERLRESGMTPDEIRSRLRAAGYSGSMLDQFLTRDTVGIPAPTQATLQAISLLGLAQFSMEDSLLLTQDTLGWRLFRDSLRTDSVIRRDSVLKAVGRLQLFGLDVFRKATTQFAGIVNGPVDDTYRLGPGDVLVLILTGEVEAAHTLEVTREGFIVIPEVGQVFVSNLALGQLRSVLYDRLGRIYSGVTRAQNAKTKFEVTVARVRVLTVRVAGDVARPGAYQVAATAGVLSALYEAGGVTERGNFRAVEVRRGSELIGTVDLYDYLLRGSTPANVRIDGGDVVFVPVRGARVKINGAVTRPAIYEVKPTETLRDLIRIAGGLTPEAEATTVTIDRILPPSERPAPGRNRTVITADLQAALDSTKAPVPLAAGDSVTVFGISGGRTQSVAIEGSVWHPGAYRLDAGMRLSDLIRIAGGTRPETYRGRAQILRVRPDSTREMIGAALDSGDDPPLREQDQVTIYARTDFRPLRYVGVYGAVKNPGRVAFADSMTLKDAILMAGGVTEVADLTEAEVARLVLDRTGAGDSIATALKVPLDSSFVGDPTGYISRPAGNAGPIIRLAPYDNILVKRLAGFESAREVVLSGEVRSPGRYTLRSKNERLSDLIERAGGLTPQAHPDGVRFFRAAATGTTAWRGARTPVRDSTGRVRPGARLPSDSMPPKWSATMDRVGLDLARVLKNNRDKDNIVLAGGDSIFIPAYSPIVRVEGSVNSPTSVTYRPGAGVSYYVDAAGGYARLAFKKGTFVQQPNGAIQKRGEPGAGAVVVVPEREAAPPSQFSLAAVLGLVGQVISAATTIAVIIVTR